MEMIRRRIINSKKLPFLLPEIEMTGYREIETVLQAAGVMIGGNVKSFEGRFKI